MCVHRERTRLAGVWRRSYALGLEVLQGKEVETSCRDRTILSAIVPSGFGCDCVGRRW
jgi:hypothetical protein